jgi:hypothetical protein
MPSANRCARSAPLSVRLRSIQNCSRPPRRAEKVDAQTLDLLRTTGLANHLSDYRYMGPSRSQLCVLIQFRSSLSNVLNSGSDSRSISRPIRRLAIRFNRPRANSISLHKLKIGRPLRSPHLRFGFRRCYIARGQPHPLINQSAGIAVSTCQSPSRLKPRTFPG